MECKYGLKWFETNEWERLLKWHKQNRLSKNDWGVEYYPNYGNRLG